MVRKRKRKRQRKQNIYGSRVSYRPFIGYPLYRPVNPNDPDNNNDVDTPGGQDSDNDPVAAPIA